MLSGCPTFASAVQISVACSKGDLTLGEDFSGNPSFVASAVLHSHHKPSFAILCSHAKIAVAVSSVLYMYVHTSVYACTYVVVVCIYKHTYKNICHVMYNNIMTIATKKRNNK